MRRNFKTGDTFAIGQAIEWRHGSHWLAGEITGAVDRDTLGYAFYPVRNLRATRTVSRGADVRGYPGSLRASEVAA